MVEATFKIQPAEFTPAFFEQIREFLNGSGDAEIVLQIRSRRRAARKKGGLPRPLPESNGRAKSELAAAASEVFLKKYPQQPSPEEGEKLLFKFVSQANGSPSQDLARQISDRADNPPSENRVLRIIQEMDVQEPIEELLAQLSA